MKVKDSLEVQNKLSAIKEVTDSTYFAITPDQMSDQFSLVDCLIFLTQLYDCFYLMENNELSEAKVILRLKNILSQRWQRIRKTPLDYTVNTQSPINKLADLIAGLVIRTINIRY